MFTALHYASLNGHSETVQLLLQCSADPNICSKVSMSSLKDACVLCLLYVYCMFFFISSMYHISTGHTYIK